MTAFRLSLYALALLPGTLAYGQADPAILERIVDEGKNRSQVMDHLKYLSKSIGHRLTSSESLDKAYAWTQRKFKEFGCTNVHLEEWGEWPVGFQRGKCSGAMVAPERVEFQFTTPSWTEGTRGRKRGTAVYAPTTMEEFNAVRDKLKGAWVVYKTAAPRPPRGRRGEAPPPLTSEQQAAKDLADAINGAGILGSVVGSRNELVLTSGNYRDKTFEEHPMDVTITIRKADMDKVVANMDAGKPVQLEFDLNQKFVKGPRKLYNVVAEVKGSEKPDEVVIVGGHLDSWDGPGAEGAADNGTGSAAVLEVSRILNKVGAKPKRTIRFVLFTGEEQGLFGSSAYVAAHKDELPKISAVFIEDNGANWESGTYALESQIPFLQPIVDLNNKTFPEMPMALRTVARMPRGGGSDHVPFNIAGVPAFFWDKQGTADYGFIHHTQNDRLEYVPAAYMVQQSVNQAVAVYTISCHPQMMPRESAPTAPGGGGG